MLALSNLATSFASAILAKDTASEGGLLVDKETREAVATSQALKMYTIGEGGSENERRLRKLQAGKNSPFSFFTTVSVEDALGMLLDCYEGTENVSLRYKEGDKDFTKVICTTTGCPATTTSIFTMDNGVPVAGELCTGGTFKEDGENDYYTFTLPAEGSGGGFVASSVGGFAASSGGGSGGFPEPPVVY